MYLLIHRDKWEHVHVGDSPVEGHSRDGASKCEGSLIAMDTMGQHSNLGKDKGQVRMRWVLGQAHMHSTHTIAYAYSNGEHQTVVNVIMKIAEFLLNFLICTQVRRSPLTYVACVTINYCIHVYMRRIWAESQLSLIVGTPINLVRRLISQV